jgi:hypothetical protein
MNKDWIMTFHCPDDIHQAWERLINDRAERGHTDRPLKTKFNSEILSQAMKDILIKEGYYGTAEENN